MHAAHAPELDLDLDFVHFELLCSWRVLACPSVVAAWYKCFVAAVIRRAQNSSLPRKTFKMMRRVLCVALVGYAAAFMATPSALPSLRRTGAQCTAVVMKSEQDATSQSLSTRRMVVGGLFGLLAPLAGMTSLPADADAARSGGRVGGGSFRPKSAPRPAAPRPAAPRASRSAPAPATVISRPSVTVIQSAPAFGGYGGGYGGFGGGFGGGMFGNLNMPMYAYFSAVCGCRAA